MVSTGLSAWLGVSLLASAAAFPPPRTCQMSAPWPAGNSYPPDNAVTRYTVDLDLPQSERWNALATQYGAAMIKMIDAFLEHLEVGPLKQDIPELLAAIGDHADTILTRMPYGDELKGLAASAGADIAKVILFNLGYELMGACTSVVAQDSDGHTIHGRNLDFGLFLGHNFTGPNDNFQWTNTQLLRDLTVMVDFTTTQTANGTSGGDARILHSDVVYVGYVGTLTGVQKGAVTVSVDSRFDDNRDAFLVHWLKNPSDPAQLLSQTLRSNLEQTDAAEFDNYVSTIGSTRLVGPAYAIIGGPSVGQGSVLTLGPNMTQPIDDWRIPQGLPSSADSADKFYVLETNYDHWDAPPIVDDRRTAALDCMDNYIGESNVSKESVYSMLTASPNKNRLTTYTALMDCAAGTLEVSLQYCWEDSCVPW